MEGERSEGEVKGKGGRGEERRVREGGVLEIGKKSEGDGRKRRREKM